MGVQIQPLMPAPLRNAADLCNELFREASLPRRRCNKHTRQPWPEFRTLGQVIPGKGSPSEKLFIFQGYHCLPAAIALAIFKFPLPIEKRLGRELVRKLFVQP